MRQVIRSLLVAALAGAMGGCVGVDNAPESASQALLVNCNALLATGPHVPVPTVLNATITGPGLVSGGSTVTMNVASTDPTHYNVDYTCIGVFDAGMTSDPATGGTRQLGAIVGPPTFTDAQHLSIGVNPASLPVGMYWLRMVTRLPGVGNFEAAEGVIMVN